MIFNPISTQDTALIHSVYHSYITSFPEDERRSEAQFFHLWNNPKVAAYSIEVEGISVGYLITWKLSFGVFIEHFEVYSEFRNKKYGSKILQEFIKIHPLLILESEPEDLNEIAARRIAFYKRNNFQIIDEYYIQPAYDASKSALPLYLMSTKNIEDILALTKEIHQTVYGI